MIVTEYGLPLTGLPPRSTTNAAEPDTVAENCIMQLPVGRQSTDVLATPPSVALMSDDETEHADSVLQALSDESFTRT